MDMKLKDAVQKLKSALAEVEACMNMEAQDPEMEEASESPEMEASEPSPMENMDKKNMVKAMMKKKGY